MKRSTIVALAFMVAAAMAGGPVHPAPCVGFDDVESTDPSCPGVEWMKNRGITKGCAANLFCPDWAASRVQVASFLARTGTLLPPTFVDANRKAFGIYLHSAGDWFGYQAMLRHGGHLITLTLFQISDVEMTWTYGAGGAAFYELPNCTGKAYIEWHGSDQLYYLGQRYGVVVFNGTSGPAWLFASKIPARAATGYASRFFRGNCENVTGVGSLIEADRLVDLATIWTEPFTIE